MSYKDLSGIYPILYIVGVCAFGYLIYIIWKYAKGLNDSPRELWLVSLSQVTEFISYSLMLTVLTLFLSSDVGYSDIAAGNIMGAWNLSYTILMFGVGALVDAVGVKRVLVIGTILAIISRLAFAVTMNMWALTLFGFALQAISVAFMSPVITVAIKRYTKSDTSAMGFALFYTLMNIGFAIGGWLFDYIRNVFGEYGHVAVPLLGTMSTYRFILLVAFFTSIPAMIFISLMRDGLDLNDNGTLDVTTREKRLGVSFLKATADTVKSSFADAYKIFLNVAKQRAFWKFMLLLTILMGVNYVFYHFSYTFPKYGIRVLGEGAAVGQVYGTLNPVVIVFFVPVIAYLTRKWSPYLMITVGSFVSALSVFLVIIPEKYFMPLVDTTFGRLLWQEWLGVPEGTDPTKLALYLAMCAFIVFFTIGEAIWSPRLMEYTARIAPKGQEASYMTLSMLPKFISQPLVALMSGGLLTAYTPMVDKTDPSTGKVILDEAGKAVQVVGDISNHHMVWFWVGVLALVSPIGMLIFKKWVGTEQHGKQMS